MNRTYRKYIYLIALIFAVAASPVSARQPNQPVLNPQGQVSPDEIEDLIYMREEEKLARDSYQVLSEQWDLAIFLNISASEQRHMDALKRLLNAFDIIDPVVEESDVGTFANPELQILFDDLMASGSQSALDGLKVGGAIEETDILDIQQAIERAENKDIINTYERLLCGSRNHLRAFVGQIEFYGEVYTPILMSQDELNAIVDSPMERGCGSKQQGKGKGNKGKGKGKKARG